MLVILLETVLLLRFVLDHDLFLAPILPFRVVLSHRTPIPVILYLYSFEFRLIPGYLRFIGAGVRGERFFVNKKIPERKSQQPNSKQLIKLEQPNDSTWIGTIQTHTTSL
jgi:hypothetical protein